MGGGVLFAVEYAPSGRRGLALRAVPHTGALAGLAVGSPAEILGFGRTGALNAVLDRRRRRGPVLLDSVLLSDRISRKKVYLAVRSRCRVRDPVLLAPSFRTPVLLVVARPLGCVLPAGSVGRLR